MEEMECGDHCRPHELHTSRQFLYDSHNVSPLFSSLLKQVQKLVYIEAKSDMTAFFATTEHCCILLPILPITMSSPTWFIQSYAFDRP